MDSNVTSMKLYDLLRRGAARASERIAITHGDTEIDYRDLVMYADSIAERLREHDLPDQARIGLLWGNSIEYVAAFFAITAAGYVVVPLDSSLKPDKIAFILNDCDAHGLIIQAKLARQLEQILPDDTSVTLVLSDQGLQHANGAITTETFANGPGSSCRFQDLVKDLPAEVLSDDLKHDTISDLSDDLAAIFYTSGSTGNSKGVMLSHRNLVSNTIATVEYLRLTEADSIMQILPLYYIYGNSLMLTHLMVGGRIVIDNRFAFPQVILKTMANQKVTGFSGVPSNFMFLLGKKGFDGASLPDLRYLTQAGGGMAPEVIRRTMNVFPDQQLFIMYGQTEASPRVTWLPPDMLVEKLGSIGIPVPGVDIQVMDETGSACPVNTVGEIVVSGPNVMLGYWNQPGEQAEVLRDGLLFTGDLARCDSDGYYWVVSRKKEIIKVGGNRVSAREVEECLLEHPAAREVAVISVEDDILGEAIKAFVVLQEGARPESADFVGHCKMSLPVHKVPKYVEFIDTLPKHQSGKINKLALSSRSRSDPLRS